MPARAPNHFVPHHALRITACGFAIWGAATLHAASTPAPLVPLPAPVVPATPIPDASARVAPSLPSEPSLLPSYRLTPEPAQTNDTPTATDSPRATPSEVPLDSRVALFRVQKMPLASALQSLNRGHGLVFVLDGAISGEITLELRDTTVRDIVEAVAQTCGCAWEQQGRVISFRKTVTRFYQIDHPQLTRTAQGSSTITLSSQATGATGGGVSNGTSPLLVQQNNAGGNSGAANQNDQTNISIQQQNQTTFWADVQTELSRLADTGESVSINKLAGIAIVTASLRRQRDFASYIETINRRIAQQVRITAGVLEVSLTSQRKLGVDWSLAATTAGGVNLTGFATKTAFATISGAATIPSTISGTVATGKIAAIINALAEQGEVRAVSNPSIVTLHNQTAFVKVGTEQTFFSLANTTTINQSGTTAPLSTVQNNYQQTPITIGTVLYVTPEVNGDGSVTVDVLPAVTQLIGVDTSPDGQRNAPRMTIKSLSTIARLRPNESVMIGGLIYEQTSTQTQKIPVLGAIPVLGRAFQTDGAVKTRSELVIFLTAERIP